MYLSRLILNPRNRRVQKEAASTYQLHRNIMKAFPDGLKEGQERVLFRLEEHPRTGALTLLVQSLHSPDWSWLEALNASDYLLPECLLPPGVHDNPSTKPFDLALSPGQALAFRLRANPTVKRKFPNGDHKRVGLYGEEEQIQWLQRKAEPGGFALLSVRTSRQDIARGQLKRDDETHKLHLLSVQFDGLLRVRDPDRLRESVRSGIGSGKGLGFGLLSLAPPR